jgi:hypothetical protein
MTTRTKRSAYAITHSFSASASSSDDRGDGYEAKIRAENKKFDALLTYMQVDYAK